MLLAMAIMLLLNAFIACNAQNVDCRSIQSCDACVAISNCAFCAGPGHSYCFSRDYFSAKNCENRFEGAVSEFSCIVDGIGQGSGTPAPTSAPVLTGGTSPGSASNSSSLGLIVAIIISVLVFAMIGVFIVFRRQRAKAEFESQMAAIHMEPSFEEENNVATGTNGEGGSAPAPGSTTDTNGEGGSAPAPGSTRLFVVTLTGKRLILQVNPSETVATVKQRIAAELGSPPASQRLIFAGKQLEDSKSLVVYNIGKDATVHLVLRVGGAGGASSNDTQGPDDTGDVSQSESLTESEKKGTPTAPGSAVEMTLGDI